MKSRILLTFTVAAAAVVVSAGLGIVASASQRDVQLRGLNEVPTTTNNEGGCPDPAHCPVPGMPGVAAAS